MVLKPFASLHDQIRGPADEIPALAALILHTRHEVLNAVALKLKEMEWEPTPLLKVRHI